MYDVGGSLYVEHGVAFHPHLGRVAGHEEGWVDVDMCISPTRGGRTQKGEDREDAQEGECAGKKVCVVLKCEMGDEVRGTVIRVGKWVQGVVQVGGRVATERWEFQGDGEGAWKRVGRTGEWLVPCAVTFKEERVRVGGKVGFGEFEWVVDEVWVWE